MYNIIIFGNFVPITIISLFITSNLYAFYSNRNRKYYLLPVIHREFLILKLIQISSVHIHSYTPNNLIS